MEVKFSLFNVFLQVTKSEKLPEHITPYTELICSGSVSDFVTMSESLDQGAKG
jgi:hypothetical protein